MLRPAEEKGMWQFWPSPQKHWPSLRLFWLLPSRHSFSFNGSKSPAVKISGNPCCCFLELSIMVRGFWRQHQAEEELNLPISRDRCSKYSGPWVPGASSQDPNHQWAIMSLPSWRQPSISLWFPAWPAQILMLLEALNSLPHWEAELRRHGDAEIPPLFPASPFPLPFQLPLLWALQFAVWWSESSDKHWSQAAKNKSSSC